MLTPSAPVASASARGDGRGRHSRLWRRRVGPDGEAAISPLVGEMSGRTEGGAKDRLPCSPCNTRDWPENATMIN
ncbi:MAG: hypothetical protein E5X56_07465 [Mesorhizobium sp.]|nr:MAG: hypothetical protein E5X56_07465 [Mesorhizobium sp.]